MTGTVLAHGGTGGAIAEAALLLFPVVAFFVLSRWSKRRERAEADRDAPRHAGTDGEP
jgi:Zn-dependent protease with chaperone function